VGIFTGPRSRCCQAFDYVEVRTPERHVAVCLACEHVFCDIDLPAPPRKGLLSTLLGGTTHSGGPG